MFMFAKFYDWLRLFEVLSLWTQLIEQSIIDAIPVMVIVYLGAFSIGFPIAILDMGRNLQDESRADLHELVDILAEDHIPEI